MTDLPRRLTAEFLGTALLLVVIVGSGIAVGRLGDDGAGQLFAHAIAVGLGLAALIALLGPVSGAHFNPGVTLGFLRTGGIGRSDAAAYVCAQVLGGVVGVAVANWTFGRPALGVATTARDGGGQVGGEVVATFVLVLLILGLVQLGKLGAVAPAVGGWVAAAIVATASTGFANPAVTVGRMFTDTYTGIAPASVLPFVAAQFAAALVAAFAARVLFPADARSDLAAPTGESR